MNKENKTLLQLRSKDQSNAGTWALFGGHIEDNESPELALVREIKEEINYYLEKFKLIKKTTVSKFGEFYWFYGVIDVDINELSLNEGDNFKFFSYEEMLKLEIAPNSRKILIDFYENKV